MSARIFELHSLETDDAGFLDLCIKIVEHVTAIARAEDCFLLHIDNWFDHKWLNFPYQRRASGGPDDRTPVPCFNPSRVVHERHYVRSRGAGYSLLSEKKTVHGPDGLYWNSHKRVADVSTSAAMFWYAGNTKDSGRGSMMCYVNAPQSPGTWYASFQRNGRWKLGRCKGIPREFLLRIVEGMPFPDEWETHVYVMLGLECDDCGASLDCEHCWDGLAPGEEAAQHFTDRAVKLARGAGWSLESDPPRACFFCPQCTAKRTGT